MVHITRPVRSRLLAATAVTMTIAAPLALASTASACWCPTGMHESAPGTETCVADVAPPTTTTTQAVTPPATTETPAPAETAVVTPAATPAAPAPAPAAPAAPAPAPAAPAPAPVAAQATPAVTPVAAEKPASAVKGIHSTGHRTVHKTAKTVVSAASTPVAAPAVKATQAEELPFTGIVGGLGLLLTATGFVLRRRTREPEGVAAP
jgi:hypothetical protein